MVRAVNFAFRFTGREVDPEQAARSPPALTVPVDPYRASPCAAPKPARALRRLRVMWGCVACAICAQRPSPCRDFAVSWANGVR